MAFSRQECWSGLPFPSPSTTLSSGEPWNLTPGPVLVLSEDLDLHCGPPVCRPDAGVPLHGLLPPRASSTHCPQLRIPGRPASQPTNFVVCFNVSCLFFFFFKAEKCFLKRLSPSLQHPGSWPPPQEPGMYQGGPEPLATLARALWPHTPGVRSDHSHWPQGTPARSPPYAKRADTGGCQSFVSPGLAGQDSRTQARKFSLR